MNTLTWIVIAVVVAAIYLSQMAGRLDRLHIRVDNSRRALQDQLLRRASEAAELAALPGATTPDLAVAFDTYAHVVRRDEEINPEIEEALTVALNFALPDVQTIAAIAGVTGGSEILDELQGTCRKVEYAKTFHDDAVRQCQTMRGKPIVKIFRLWGTAAWPERLECDLTQPDGFA